MAIRTATGMAKRDRPCGCAGRLNISQVELAQVALPEFWCCACTGVAVSMPQHLEVAVG